MLEEFVSLISYLLLPHLVRIHSPHTFFCKYSWESLKSELCAVGVVGLIPRSQNINVPEMWMKMQNNPANSTTTAPPTTRVAFSTSSPACDRVGVCIRCLCDQNNHPEISYLLPSWCLLISPPTKFLSKSGKIWAWPPKIRLFATQVIRCL